MGDRQVPQAQPLDPGVIDAVAARRALDRGLGQLQTARFGAHHGALECARAPGIVDRGPEPLELAGRRMMQPGRDEQTVERELEAGATGRCVADGDSEVLLQRRAGVEPDVVVRPKETGLAEALERGGQLACGPEQLLVVAPTVRLEPVAVLTCVARITL